MVPVRRHAFKRAVANLVNNAARFAEHVNVSAAKQNGALTVAVEDDGPGIPEAEHEQVFRPFYRIDHARNQDRARPGWAWPSPATSPAFTAATSRSAGPRSAD